MSDYDYSAKMQEIQQSNAQTIASYFSNLSTTSTSSTSSTSSEFAGIINNLSDYSLIRSGSYTKLMKAYYSNLTEANADSTTDDTKSLKLSSNDAAGLKEAATKLGELSYDKVTKTTKDETTGKETTTTDYDWDSLYKAASSFVESYNDVIDSVGDLNSSTILKKAVRMTNDTATNKALLAEVGITVKSDNTLSIDKDTFEKADINKIKTLFEGKNSYASKIATRASEIANMASNAAYTSSTGGSRMYTQTGSYSSVSTSSVLDSFS